ncbi:MAG TPA: hypothetical protein VE173_12940, partial [Longimicrobiales bacterium]|nr:hypothetical protein [Longimicrobiales bacterium]
MSREARYFPYRFGEALWAYIGGEYGDLSIVEIFRRSLRMGFQPAIGQVLGTSTDTLSVEWRRKVEQAYVPLMSDRQDPDSVGTVILSPETGAGEQNVSPSLSPDGRYLAFLSTKDLFSVDLFLADARTGEIIRKLASAASDPHADAIRYVESSGTWSPDSERFAYTVFAGGDSEIDIVDVASGDLWKRIEPPGLGALNNPAWSPDGRYLVFTGFVGGISDLYLWDLEEDALTQLTHDKNADFQPAWSPDGSTIAFATDRGPKTDFGELSYSNFQLALLHLPTRQVEVLPVFGDVRHSNPQFAPDGRSLYFLSDRDGFSDIYQVGLDGGPVRRLTRVVTGVSGITGESPALTVASRSGDIAFSVFTHFEFHIQTLPAGTPGEEVARTVAESELRGRQLPPTDPNRFSRVAEYLSDPATGLPDPGTFSTSQAKDYHPGLQLDYIGQPTIGAGTDRFGGYVGGGASAYFSDMLGNRFLGVAIQAQGTLKDIGGQIAYQDVSDRWNWAVGGGHIPYLLMFQTYGQDENGAPYLGVLRKRILITSASGIVAYPFSSTRRVEFSGGVVRYGMDLEEDRYFLDQFNRVVDIQRVQLDDLEPSPVNLVQGSAAYVGDNSFFGFTSPVRGGRFRFELQGTTGSQRFLTAIGDWRR